MNASSIARTAATPVKSPATLPSAGFGAEASGIGGRDTSFSTLLSQTAARAAVATSSRIGLPAMSAATSASPGQVAKSPAAPLPRTTPAPASNAETPASAEQAAARRKAESADSRRSEARPADAMPADTKTSAPANGSATSTDKTAGKASDASAADGSTGSTAGSDAATVSDATTDPKSMQARLRLAKQASDARAARGADDAARPDPASDMLHGGRGVKGAGNASPAEGEAVDGEANASSVDDESVGTDASPLADLHAWLAAQALPPDAAPAGKGAGAPGGDTAAAAGSIGGKGLPGSQAMADDPRDASLTASAHGAASLVDAGAASMHKAMEEGAGRAMEGFGQQLHAASAGVAGLEGLAAVSGGRPAEAPMNASTSGTADAPPPEFTLATPVDAPEFTQSLGVQVSLMARDGIGEAKLHLNPVEMGPIAINIVMDGASARVDFTAASAETRQVIEAGLPELASALKEAGVTLSGGGVFDQPSQSSSGQPERDAAADSRAPRSTSRLSSGGEPAASSREAAAVVRRSATIARGGVDTYA